MFIHRRCSNISSFFKALVLGKQRLTKLNLEMSWNLVGPANPAITWCVNKHGLFLEDTIKASSYKTFLFPHKHLAYIITKRG